MYKNSRFLGIIPARGGSKGIPNKNIKEIFGKPLISYTIEECLKSNYLDKIIVSTEDEIIKKVAVEAGAEVPFLRPQILAEDTSKSIEAVIFTLNELRKKEESYDYVVLLQPTQPLKQFWQIDEAIEKITAKNGGSLLSVSIVSEHPLLMRTLNDDGTLKNLIDSTSSVRRQDFPEYYKVNGAIYINKVTEDFNVQTSLNDNKLAYVMDKKYDLDIDEFFDLEILKLKLNNLY